jgi:hypothetical protein
VTIINLRYSGNDTVGLVGDAAEFVIQKALDDVRLYAELGEAGSEGAPEIVQGPMGTTVIEFGFEFAPAREWPIILAACGKEKVGTVSPWYAGKNIGREAPVGEYVLRFVLRDRVGQRDSPLSLIEPRPGQ